MYMSDYTVQLLHQDRLREAERRRAHQMVYDAAEPTPVVEETGLWYQIKNWLRSRNHSQQESHDVRRANAI